LVPVGHGGEMTTVFILRRHHAVSGAAARDAKTLVALAETTYIATKNCTMKTAT
jgi:hypothetical protein